ncbi:MAG: tetratricopeptide repeat protein [candidate division Zixibacteria bacterium]|nr:tetratricopeptide repeat protein [candidate division Zixibacteria bacterium]
MIGRVVSTGLLLILILVLAIGCGKKSEEELFSIAEQAQEDNNPIEAVKAYMELLDLYPDGDHSPKAMFMIGFVYSEELADTGKAVEAFENFLKKYPDNELVPSATFMVQALKGEVSDPVISED